MRTRCRPSRPPRPRLPRRHLRPIRPQWSACRSTSCSMASSRRARRAWYPGPTSPSAALEVLVAGPTDADSAAGLTTAIVPRVSILSFAIDGDNATVDFNRAFETADTQPQVAQVVYTLTQFTGTEHGDLLDRWGTERGDRCAAAGSSGRAARSSPRRRLTVVQQSDDRRDSNTPRFRDRTASRACCK